MKKLTVIILAIAIVFSLCACGAGKSEPEVEKVPEVVEEPEKEPVQPEVKEEPVQEETAPVEVVEEPAFDEALYNKAKEFENGGSVDELKAAIGEPVSEDYTTGCSGHEEEGMLVYEGFTVYTYRDNGVATVYIVELD